jgi:hypothetical protein
MHTHYITLDLGSINNKMQKKHKKRSQGEKVPHQTKAEIISFPLTRHFLLAGGGLKILPSVQ